MAQPAQPQFDGTPEELEALLMEGIDSPELSDEEFWRSVDETTDAILAEYNRIGRGSVVRDSLLLKGLNSGDPIAADPKFWNELKQDALKRLESRRRDASKK